ncbi:MAG: TetR/AcrR family transcriptional regulator [Eggerthellaceae bacterium]|jgi:AcrR family transcriptional regulator
MDLRKERTLKLLSESLIALLHEKPYSNVTVSEICEGAMVRRATFYRHFSGKNDLLAYTVAARRAQLDVQVDPDGTMPLPEYCHNMTKEFLRLVDEHRTMIRKRSLSPEFAFVNSLLADELSRQFERKLAERTGREIPDGRLRELASFYANGLVGTVGQYAATPEEADEGELLDFIDDVARRLFA